MKPLLPLAIAISALSFGPTLDAQTTRDSAQTSNGTYDWFNTANWRVGGTPPPQTVPNGSTFVANFNPTAAEIGAGQSIVYDLTSNATLSRLIMSGAGTNLGRSATITGTGGSLTMNNTVSAGARAEIQVNGTTNQEALTVSAGISFVDADGTDIVSNASFLLSGPLSGASNLSKNGTATVFLGGSNSYSGNLTILNGSVLATSSSAFSGSSAGISFDGNTANSGLGTRASGTTTVSSALTLGNGTFTNTLSHGGSGSVLDLTSNTISSGTGSGTINISRVDGTDAASFGLPALTGNGSVRFSGTGFNVTRNVAINANSSLVLNPGSGTQTWSGNLTGSGVSIVKTGAGTTVINNTIANNANTFSGALVVSEGILQTGQAGAVQFRGLNSVSSILVESGAILEFGRDSLSTGSAVTINGTMRSLTGGTTYQTFGSLTMNGGTLQFRGGVTSTFQGGALGGSVTISGSSASTISTSGASNTGLHLASNSAGVNRVFTVNDATGSAAVDLTVSTSLLDSSNAAGAAALTKNGTGTMLLSAVNAYTGNTTVNAGTLLINGSTTASSAVEVNSSGTLGGNGTVGGAVSINSGGRLAPGNSTGILTINNSLTVTSGTLSFQLNGATVGTGYDQVLLTGGSAAFTLSGSSNLELALGFTPAVNSLFFLVNNTGTSAAISGTFSELNGVAATLTQGASFFVGGQEFLISYTGNSAGNTFTGGNDLVLQAVPEPGTWAMVGLGLAVVFLARRRRPL